MTDPILRRRHPREYLVQVPGNWFAHYRLLRTRNSRRTSARIATGLVLIGWRIGRIIKQHEARR